MRSTSAKLKIPVHFSEDSATICNFTPRLTLSLSACTSSTPSETDVVQHFSEYAVFARIFVTAAAAEETANFSSAPGVVGEGLAKLSLMLIGGLSDN
jgi:hypothetical protein